jgi:hypothetical protein
MGSSTIWAAEVQNNASQTSDSQVSELQTSELQRGEEESDGEQTSIFAELPESFIFSSGVGAWWTGIDLAEDGTFSGQFMDSDMGDRGDGYPNGTVYICSFSGRFSQAEQVDDKTWSMKLESLEQEEASDIVTYEDGVRYITADPYGFDNADQFYIYLPGSALADLPEGFVNWTYAHFYNQEVLPEGYYGIYNEGGEEGFVGVKEETQSALMSEEEDGEPVEAYQGIFMKDDTFISLPLYTSNEENDAIGIAYLVTRPELDAYGNVMCDMTGTLGEIFETDQTCSIVQDDGLVLMRFTYYDGHITVTDNDMYEGKYVQISNTGANVDSSTVWLRFPSEDGTETASAAEEYLFADSDSRFLTEADTEGLSLQQINYAKNEIYARRGRRFNSRELQDYFGSKSWYVGTIEPENFSNDIFNEYEKANIELLADLEYRIDPNGYQLDQ